MRQSPQTGKVGKELFLAKTVEALEGGNACSTSVAIHGVHDEGNASVSSDTSSGKCSHVRRTTWNQGLYAAGHFSQGVGGEFDRLIEPQLHDRASTAFEDLSENDWYDNGNELA